MFCPRCGKYLPEKLQACEYCGHNQERSRISNKAMLLAAIAALVSAISLLLSFLPGSGSMQAQDTTPTPTPVVAVTSPTATPKPQIVIATPKPKPTQETESEPEPEPTPKPIRPRPEPTPDYPYRHMARLEYPPDGAVFAQYPRWLTLRWRTTTASEAVKYRVRVEHMLPLHLGWKYWEVDVDPSQNWYAMEFPGTRTGRWRVTPIFTDGQLGLPTPYRTFRFTR